MKKKFGVLVTALAAAAFLAGCGGGGAGNQSSRVAFTQMVNFGDSLSDVGSYATALVAANGEGHYSINGDFSADGILHTNWTEFIAAQLDLDQPCAAEVGLDSVGALYFLAQAPVDSTTCTNYAQGGAMVTSPVGPGNATLYTAYGVSSGQLGQLTKPVVSQVASYLSAHTAFTSSQLVTVLAGGNDLLLDRALMVDTVVAQVVAGTISQANAPAAIEAAATTAITAMTTAGTQLATLVKEQIIANGATHVVVVNVPDVSKTPDAALWLTTGAGVVVEPIHPHLTLDMVNAFNAALAAGLSVDTSVALPKSSLAEVTWVDAFANNDDQIAHPSSYSLTNVTTPACKLTPASATDSTATGLELPNSVYPGGLYVPIASSLFCTATTLITDSANATSTDANGVQHYLFADTVHPTPWGYRLLAQLVAEKMAIKGWL